MPKYTEQAGSIIDRRWLKRIANETAETNRLLKRLKNITPTSDPDIIDEAGDDP